MIDRVAAGPRAPALRGAGRLQVVRRRAARRLARLRRRGERGRLVPAARTGRCGRRTRTVSSSTCSPPEILARTGARPGRALPRRSPARLRRADLHAHRRAGHAERRRACSRQLSPDAGARQRRWRASRSPRSSTRAPGNGGADRRAQGRRGERLVRRAARRAPRTSTRSTRRASRTRRTSIACSTRRARWSPTRCRPSELPGRARDLLISPALPPGTPPRARPPTPGFASRDQRRVRTARAAAARPSSHRNRPRPATAAPSPRSA